MKRLLVSISFMFLVVVSFAQDKHYGVRIGYQSSAFVADGDKVGSSSDNYFLSVYKDVPLLPLFFLNTGLEYSKVGGDINNSDYKLHYLGIPLAVKAKVGPVYALAGAAFNVKVSDKNNPFEDNAKWYDTNAFVGAGLEIIIFTLDVKYIWGMTEIQNNMNNNGFQVGLGLRF